MRIDNTTIYAVYGEYSALYRDKKDVPSEMEKQSFRDCEKAILSMRNHQVLVYHDYTNLKEIQNIYNYNIAIERRNQAIAYIKGSYDKNTNCYGYGMVFVSGEGIEEFNFKDYDLYGMRYVSGELEAAKDAVLRAVLLGIEYLTIVFDYIGVEKFATGEWSANQPGTEEYQNWMQEASSFMNIQFLKVKAHTGIIEHDRAEVLGKEVHQLL